jgi:hypothetical protein
VYSVQVDGADEEIAYDVNVQDCDAELAEE